ncbi:MAG: InlB B-repeat-containing protein [Dehalococcoidia bacterium]
MTIRPCRKHQRIAVLGVLLALATLIASVAGCGLTQYGVTFSSTDGGSVTTPGEGIFYYDFCTEVELIAAPARGYRFIGWSGGSAPIVDVTSASTVITSVQGNYKVRANFEEARAEQYTLTASSTAGGSVTAPYEGASTYEEGTVVVLVAMPAGGYRFVRWTGDVGTVDDVTSSSTIVTMQGNYSITAEFEAIPPALYNLTTSSTDGGWVTTPGEGSYAYAAGTEVSLVATPAGGYRFVRWSGNIATIGNPDLASTTITMQGNYSITAEFEAIPTTHYSLTVYAGTGGVVVTPGPGTFSYPSGAVVNLVASPGAGYRFAGWTGTVGTVDDVDFASTTITMNGNYAVTANFELIEVLSYTLTISSEACGSVTEPGEGVFTYDAGTVVSLVATPARRYEFSGWTGDVGMIADVNSASTTIIMYGNYSITANFHRVRRTA